MKKQSPLVPVPQVAAELGVTVVTLERCHQRGLLRFEKRVGIRANLCDPLEARQALALRRPAGRPRKDSQLSA